MELLLQIKRGNLVEREHFGYITVVDDNENILSQTGNKPDLPFFLRSCAKPFQAMPLITSGTYQKFNFNMQELAVICGSHTGTDLHVELVKSILEKSGLSEKNLLCGIHEPLDSAARNALIKQNIKPSQVHNNCSGKHAGMLAVCVKMGWNVENYLDLEHPLQKEILCIIRKYCNINEKIEKSLDGCNAPIYGMPLYKMGAGYLRLFLSPEGEQIKKTFMENPFLIGGQERLDSLIIEATKGRLIAKVGAEGLCTVINPDHKKALVVKIIDSNMTARSIVVIEALKQLGWLDSCELQSEHITKISNTDVKTLNNTVVGKIQLMFCI